jgi:hypothetical protein
MDVVVVVLLVLVLLSLEDDDDVDDGTSVLVDVRNLCVTIAIGIVILKGDICCGFGLVWWW